jgi:small-conductance mechanosensitive channel
MAQGQPTTVRNLLFPHTAKSLCLLAAFWLMIGVAAGEDPQRPFGTVVEDWNHTLELITQELGQPDLSRERAAKLTERLAAIRGQAVELQLRSQAEIEPLRQRADALGAPPREGEPPEVEAIVQERSKIAEQITGYDTRVKQAALIINRIDELLAEIKARQWGAQIETLFRQFPLPLAPSTLAAAVPEFFVHLSAVASSPFHWWEDLTLEQRKQEMFHLPVIFGALALIFGLFLRLALLRWLGRDPAIENPTYARRLVAGVSEGLASGVVPALIFGAIFYRVTSENTIFTGLLADTLAAACIMSMMIVLAYGLPRAVLAPELPDWRLVELSPANARAITRRITFLATVFAVELFFSSMSDSLSYSDSFKSVLEFVIAALEAGGVLALIQGRLWLSQSADAPQTPATGPEAGEPPAREAGAGFFWGGLRLVISAIAVAALGASLVGYSSFASYLSESLLGSGVIVGVLFLLRGLCRELIGASLRSGFLQARLAIRHATRNLFKFWLRTLLDVVAFGVGLFLILVLWGVPLAEMLAWTKGALQGITIGEVTISIVDIVTALSIFILALVVVRMLQRLLAERVLPQTGLDPGLCHSLSAGFGYLGLIIALALGTAAIGLDLTNLALIFGALSVGIGFGLQGVVNNFVSGMVLLVERPIKVGDWVVVGANEGYVKRIRLRATELETFQRASIVIPNSEIVSTAVVNWTHKDRYGRIDVPVSVAYGSDVEQVKDILMTCLKENPEIVAWPVPRILFRRYGDSALEFEARGFLSNIEAIYTVQSDILTAIDRAFCEAGIEIPFPQRDLHFRNIDKLADAIAGRRLEPADEAPSHRPPRLRKVEGGDTEGEG